MPTTERYTPAQVIKALEESKGLVFLAAKRLGCERRTIARYEKKYQAVKVAVVSAREEMKDLAESKLYQAVNNGEAWAICFYLKTRAKDRGYVERQEVTGTDAGPLKITLKWPEIAVNE